MNDGHLVYCVVSRIRGDGASILAISQKNNSSNSIRSFLFGYDMGVMTILIDGEEFLKFFGTSKSSSTVGAIVSTFSGGAVFGSLMGGSTMDTLGRRVTVQLGAVIALVGGILQAAAPNLGSILVGRIFSGWAVGLMSMSVPVYLSECSHPNVRGLSCNLQFRP
jgi:MFS family permease